MSVAFRLNFKNILPPLSHLKKVNFLVWIKYTVQNKFVCVGLYDFIKINFCIKKKSFLALKRCRTGFNLISFSPRISDLKDSKQKNVCLSINVSSKITNKPRKNRDNGFQINWLPHVKWKLREIWANRKTT